jgi:hypothetical protein
LRPALVAGHPGSPGRGARLRCRPRGTCTDTGRTGTTLPAGFIYHLFNRVRAHYASSKNPRDWPIQNLTWDYGDEEPDAELVIKEINGFDTRTGEPVHPSTFSARTGLCIRIPRGGDRSSPRS